MSLGSPLLRRLAIVDSSDGRCWCGHMRPGECHNRYRLVCLHDWASTVVLAASDRDKVDPQRRDTLEAQRPD